MSEQYADLSKNSMSAQYTDSSGYHHSLGQRIGGGGQGAVYRTHQSGIVLKLALVDGIPVKDTRENEKYTYIHTLPIPADLHITLPLATLESVSGYVMRLLDGMSSFGDVFGGGAPEGFPTPEYFNLMLAQNNVDEEFVKKIETYISTGGVRRRLSAFFHCACILARLHGIGLVYCDISDNNLFLSGDKTYNEVWLIDADNLDWYSECAKRTGFQTPGYAAPELYLGRGNSFFSDCYSFAVALFQFLCQKHPFDGPLCLDEDGIYQEDLRNGGTLPWILDEEDTSNEPEELIFPSYYCLGQRLRDSFQRTFSSDSRAKPFLRPSMSEWSWTLGEELDRTVHCSVCGMDFNGIENTDQDGNPQCPVCDSCPSCVSVRSFRPAEGGRPLWTFVREITENQEISVPFRLLRGMRTAEADENAFSLTLLSNALKAGAFHDNWEFFSVDSYGTKRKLYGEASLRQGCALLCQRKRGGSAVRIEVESFEGRQHETQ